MKVRRPDGSWPCIADADAPSSPALVGDRPIGHLGIKSHPRFGDRDGAVPDICATLQFFQGWGDAATIVLSTRRAVVPA
jgi:hypothetical protein